VVIKVARLVLVWGWGIARMSRSRLTGARSYNSR
jgi:hypothetical protein